MVTRARLREQSGAVAVEFALIMAAMTPAMIAGTDLLIKAVQYAEDYVTCQAQLVPGDPWPDVCTRFLADGVTPPDLVPGVPLTPESTPTPTP